MPANSNYRKNKLSHGGILRLLPGTVIGDSYEISEALGQSVVGRGTFKAKHMKTGMDVVLKVFPDGADLRPTIQKELERELEILLGMNHPNIPQVWARGVHKNQDYLVVELVSGRTLQKRMQRPIPMGQTVEYGKGILSALAYAHKQGVVHRNINPSSIICMGKDVKLVGFGSAKSVEQEDEQSATKSMSLDGVVSEDPYIPPEVVSEGTDKFTPSGDQYSAGFVLYHVIAGRMPFEGEVTLLVNAAKRSGDPLRLGDVNPDVSATLNDVVMKMISREPSDRYESAEAAYAALESIPEETNN